jgi:hypothetical protein
LGGYPEAVTNPQIRQNAEQFIKNDIIKAPRKISAYGMMIGVHGRGTARLFDPLPLIEAV